MKKYIVIGKKYQDKNGNTYHRVRVSEILKDGIEVIADSPVTYGYGDSYIRTAFDILNMEDREYKSFREDSLFSDYKVKTYRELKGPF